MSDSPIARVRDFMTPSPVTIGAQQSVEAAAQMMREHDVRHLPVLHGGKLVGVVSDRDVKVIEAIPDVTLEEVPIAEAVPQEVWSVPPDAPLREVAAHMAEHRYGSAVVVEGKDVVGIFTTVDALRALAQLIPG